MTTAWNHLPNAVHIDRVLASVKSHPGVWAAPWDEAWYAAWDQARDAARVAASDAARDAAWDAAWYAARVAASDAAWYAARVAARVAAREAAWYAARGAVLALVAWDNSAKFLDMTANELMMWWALSEDPACILLLPVVRAFEQIKELSLVDS